MIPTLVLAVVSVALLAVAAVAWMKARRLDREAHDSFVHAGKLLLDSENAERSALSHERAASTLHDKAVDIFAEVQRIEESLVNPRFALHKQSGRIRALRSSEGPDILDEIPCGQPDENCKKCFGRGWNGRHTAGGNVIPCLCVRRK